MGIKLFPNIAPSQFGLNEAKTHAIFFFSVTPDGQIFPKQLVKLVNSRVLTDRG